MSKWNCVVLIREHSKKAWCTMIHGNFKGSPPQSHPSRDYKHTIVPSWSLIQGLVSRGGVAFGGWAPLDSAWLHSNQEAIPKKKKRKKRWSIFHRIKTPCKTSFFLSTMLVGERSFWIWIQCMKGMILTTDIYRNSFLSSLSTKQNL